MFAYQDVINGFKSLRSAEDTPSSLSSCQALEFWAKNYGFQSYHHFRESLRRQPQDTFAKTSLKLMRLFCEKRLPTLDCAYYEFMVLPKSIGYYSNWIGWDKNGDEVRTPRPLSGKESVKGLRKAADYPIYVVESERELVAWQKVWGSTAYIPADLAKQHFQKSFNKKHLVADNPPYELIKRKRGNSDNMSNDHYE
ncbi:hypothetical protein HNO92_002216 [Chromobacterium alkanivorans]|uniref:hypothetical protein n=1 Tax=Chromobacterium TaxID=535 RepID=UPI0021696991|nr:MULTISPECIES: hypothetical protein [Chromobacterium]MCS3805047.1 hypothetical protein [Chromobacterium alkanivorans]MCS3819390.1 hypothetical protein [Chromobacterium alkanivorans]MCS3873902.1 hypothetical protein [Chromobacterium alkanivorans]MDH0341623.1 hypothetical protein [Chromobacterium haemolyticum]